MRAGGSRADAGAVLVTLLFAGWLALPVVSHPSRLPARADPDHGAQLSFCRTVHEGVGRHGEYPAWTPYLGGGFPFAGSPDHPGLTPTGLLCALLPELVALKLLALSSLLLAGLGMLRLGRAWLGLSPAAALVAALLLVASPAFAARLRSGNYFELPLFALPVFLLCFLRLAQGRWLGLLLPGLYAMGLHAKFGGLVQPAAVAVFALCARARAGLGARRLLWAFALSLAAGVALSLHRLLPLAGVLDRNLLDLSGAGARGYADLPEVLRYAVAGGRDPTLQIGAGWLALLAAGAGAALGGRRAAGLLALLAGSVLFALGPRSPLPIWSLAAQLPGLDAMRPAKYVTPVVVFALAGLAGLGAEVLRERLARRTARGRSGAWAALALGVALLLQPTLASRASYRGLYALPAFDAPPEPFHQTGSLHLAGRITRHRGLPLESREMNQYYNMRRNVGTIPWFGGVVLPERALARYWVDRGGRRHPVEGYRGELFCEPADETRSDCELGDLALTYNTIAFRARNAAPARARANFNYDPGWRSSEGRVVERDGRLAVELPAGGDRRVVLEYRNRALSVGLALGAVGALLWIAGGCAWVLRGRVDTRRRAGPSSRVPARAGASQEEPP